ncbi:RNA polymerase sigma factor [Elizabethkingia sp. JS20170427COW]|uniref:RNA polymerase sigma factor n=1 Tax=Elizabethkingia sp. JS20170427COW TaxID=2583851 RepID=UPI0011104094|nr:sigma-70 family RNA polymerase sigma factor [Elizabethkingia sp. JS20170427COW]QCX53292.1 sigma-70 family RNA polymerase sigma factor [Elizabethkingia sp. JS20170427COW]
MKTQTDDILIIDYQSGNGKSFETLLKRYQKELYNYIYFKVGNESLANDFYQDTLVKIMVKLKEGKYQEDGRFILWAKRIAQNLIIDYHRARCKRDYISESCFFSEDDTFSIFDFIPEPQMNVEEQLIQQHIYQNLYSILDLLPENQREIIDLRFFKELSFKEISEQTGCSINTSLGRVRYALINLRKLLEENNAFLKA